MMWPEQQRLNKKRDGLAKIADKYGFSFYLSKEDTQAKLRGGIRKQREQAASGSSG